MSTMWLAKAFPRSLPRMRILQRQIGNRKVSKLMKIGVDAMGGDFAPKNEILGAKLAYDALKSMGLELYVYGDSSKIQAIAAENNIDTSILTIINTTDKVEMSDDPTEILKTKKDSPLYRGLSDVANKKIDGFVSAGNTGATLTTSTVILGRIQGVSRPTIASFFPTVKARPTLLLDVGATIDHKSRFLYEFALMGASYYSLVYKTEKPTVALLNVGEEESKGTEAIKEAYSLLKNSNLNFVGNVEGRDILLGTVDVVVCDGYVGNVILKFAESFGTMLKTKLKQMSTTNIINKIKVSLSIPALKGLFKDLDYQEYGGVPVLGVNGISIVGHGKSSPIAIKNMIKRAMELHQNQLVTKIENIIKLNTTKN